MSYSPMDLDSSLDDLIKKRKTSKTSKTDNNKKNKQNITKPPIQTTKAKVSKPAPSRPTSNINSRLSTTNQKKSAPVFTSKNKPQPQQQNKKPDPSKIIITKNIASKSSVLKRVGGNNNSNNNNNKANNDRPGNTAQTNTLKVKSNVRGRLGNITSPISMIPQAHREQQLPLRNMSESRPGQGFTIRGISNTVDSSRPFSMRDNSGPTTVLVTGLDQHANSHDVRMFLEQFGDILHCEVLKNRAGQSFGEAEVEFSSKGAALDCISMLDNRMADGRFLRIILRESKPPQNFAQKQIRSVISSVSASGRMYADQTPSRYDIHRQ